MDVKAKAAQYVGLNEAERLEIARLLVKAGYTVRITAEKDRNGRSVTIVEFWEDKE